jgi:hypothetical protein
MKEERNVFWNQRYSRAEYVYGEEPKELISLLKPKSD